MPFGIGSKSAQTPSESSQQSNSNIKGAIQSGIAGLEDDGWYRVYHKWRKVGSQAQRGMPHHSQLFITDADGNAIGNFGLFGDSNGNVVYDFNEQLNPVNPYHVSTSYKPNPVIGTGTTINKAVVDASLKCGPNYKLLHNNCQKFARLVMIELGASHNRELFHP